ncbi:[weak similarity to] acetylornithine and succinylornithine aminotransferase [methanotrophic bacterial endosymbiont of Bathymodiolus sp.]|nr:[weak similarity to] acetylornithine and succinylornithine aminotransferase [methanotrophic bacterial endosymbiont of Bathymodiolus sp.]
MMIGIELDMSCAALVSLALDAGLLINVTGDTSIRLLPPLIISYEQIDMLVDTLSSLIDSHTK